jgi:hypothetical protein
VKCERLGGTESTTSGTLLSDLHLVWQSVLTAEMAMKEMAHDSSCQRYYLSVRSVGREECNLTRSRIKYLIRIMSLSISWSVKLAFICLTHLL